MFSVSEVSDGIVFSLAKRNGSVLSKDISSAPHKGGVSACTFL